MQGTANDTVRLATREARGPAWPFGALPAALVVGLSLGVALIVALFGVAELRQASDHEAAARATLLSQTLAASLAEPDADGQPSVPQGAREFARREEGRKVANLVRAAHGVEAIVVDASGALVHNHALGEIPPARIAQLVAAHAGLTEGAIGRAQFACAPVGQSGKTLIVFARAPKAPDEVATFLAAVSALALLLILTAGVAAYAIGIDATHDVAHVTARIAQMAILTQSPAGSPIAPRGLDAVGQLTLSFEDLRRRFAVASSEYAADLNRAQGQDQDRAAFLAAVSHELRTPLNSVLGFADILLSEVDGPLSDSQREDVEQIRGGGARLIELINDILEFSALEGGQLKLKLERVDLNAIAATTLKEAAILLVSDQVELRMEPSATVYALADPRRVHQILWNLVGNAVKFTQRGSIVVGISRRDNLAVIEVRDTGPGISSEERSLIFEEYTQTKSEKLKKRGSGLGLAITRRLARLHGGGVELESELGAGSTFRVTLPLASPRLQEGSTAISLRHPRGKQSAP